MMVRGFEKRFYSSLSRARGLIVAVPYLWLILFFLIPFFIVLRISFSTSQVSLPPYSSLIEFLEGDLLKIKIYMNNYRLIFEEVIYRSAYFYSLKIAIISTLSCLAVGYPIAYVISRLRQPYRIPCLVMIILPMWTSFLIRVYALIGLIKPNGLINQMLMELGVISVPLRLLYTDFAVCMGIVYAYLPFMILPLYSSLRKIEPQIIEAAEDLGAGGYAIFTRILLPLSLPGILAGSLLVFIPATGEFVIPDLLGGVGSIMVGKVLWTEFFNNRDWPMAAALTIATLVFLVIPILVFRRFEEKYIKRDEE